MAEEDLIFGKNRHFFGGIEPSNMLAFSAVFVAQYGGVMIAATLPNDTVVNNQTLCTVETDSDERGKCPSVPSLLYLQKIRYRGH